MQGLTPHPARNVTNAAPPGAKRTRRQVAPHRITFATVARVTRRRRQTIVLFLAALATLLAAAAPADAAKRKVPFGFFGTVFGVSPQNVRDGQFALMAQNGVESVRVGAYWHTMEPQRGVYNFAEFDSTVRAAAVHGLDPLTTVFSTPGWASPRADQSNYNWYAPRDYNDYANFLRALIGRYGPNGTFWAENPTIPKRPLRTWQVWNEPAASYFWATPNYRKTYPRLLRVAYRAVHAADPGATVVTAGLASLRRPNGKINLTWNDLKTFYRNGARRSFDALAIHPFTKTVGRVVESIKRHRRVMRSNGEGRKPIYLTELSWPASKGRIPRSRLIGIEVRGAKQRRLLAAAYKRLIRDRGLRVRRAYWYNWATTYSSTPCAGESLSFQFAGLMRTDCRQSTFSPTPLLSAYARTARRYQGCAKSADARRCA
jgi:hypothetical protein